MKKRFCFKFVIVCAFLVFRFSQPVSAADGDLDTSFGGNGFVTTDIFGNADQAYGVAVQADGKIVVAGQSQVDFALTRYNPDGSLDSTFGNNGKVTTDFFGGFDAAHGLAIQLDGKIVAVGTTGLDFAVARYNPNGTLDTTFGAGGLVETDFDSGIDVALAVAINNKRITVAGLTYNGVSSQFAVAQYLPDGTLDSLINNTGTITTSFTGGLDGADAVAIQPDGYIVVAGRAGTAWGLARYDKEGELDFRFGNGGLVITNFAGDTNSAGAGEVLVQTDGKIIATGIAITGTKKDFALARYNSDGTLDPTFNGTGIVTTDFVGGDDSGQGAVLQPDGKIVVAGLAFVQVATQFALARYDSNGSLDPTFGANGKVLTDLPGVGEGANAIALQADGRIVVAGFANPGNTYDFAIARYNNSFSTDNCLFCDDFTDGILAPNWTYTTTSWVENSGSLRSSSGKAIASPAFAGCDLCTVETTILTEGGAKNQVALLAWYKNAKDDIELVEKKNSKWILRQRSGGKVVSSFSLPEQIVSNVPYDVKLTNDGTYIILRINGLLRGRLETVKPPFGTVGFSVKNTVGILGFISVRTN